jgi:outer membrane protein assembly factor BamA
VDIGRDTWGAGPVWAPGPGPRVWGGTPWVPPRVPGYICPAMHRRAPLGRLGWGVALVVGAGYLVPTAPATAQRAGVPGQGREARCAPPQRVRAVRFAGEPQLDRTAMASRLVTQAPTALARLLRPAAAPCVDSLEVRRDALRLAVLHRQAGWYRAAVTAALEPAPGGTTVRFTVTPGAALRIDSVRIVGLPAVGTGRRRAEAPLVKLQGERYDRALVEQALDTVVARLGEAGYVRARRPVLAVRVDSAAARVHLEVTVDAGRPVTVGTVQVEVDPVPGKPARVSPSAIRRMAQLTPGRLLRAGALLEAQRALYRADAFRLVLLDTLTPLTASRDSVLDLRIAVAEARTRSARLGVGWATQDCLRAQGRVTDRGFLGLGRRVELSARASKVGRGAPADFAPGLCAPALRVDPFSERLNYYVGASLANRTFFGLPVAPLLTVYSERRGEPFAYLRETGVGALAELTRPVGARSVATVGFQYENGRTVSDPVVSCTRFGQCRPEDVLAALFGRGVGIASAVLTHEATDDPLDPRHGWRARAEGRLGRTSSILENAVGFRRGALEVAGYGVAGGGTVAARLQWSRVWAPGATQVDGAPLLPPQERLFAGGQNSVRGFQQNLLGPLAYVVTDVTSSTRPDGTTDVVVTPGAGYARAVPRGGTAMAVANLEYRRGLQALAQPIQLVGFVDAGTVWEGATAPLRLANLRVTPGLGVRVVTPLGPFRVDIGYAPYEPPAGQALYFAAGSNGEAGQIFCASPAATSAARADVTACPSTFRPSRATGVLSRLVFHFGLGQAF